MSVIDVPYPAGRRSSFGINANMKFKTKFDETITSIAPKRISVIFSTPKSGFIPTRTLLAQDDVDYSLLPATLR
jgi:hypothetical protein